MGGHGRGEALPLLRLGLARRPPALEGRQLSGRACALCLGEALLRLGPLAVVSGSRASQSRLPTHLPLTSTRHSTCSDPNQPCPLLRE
jgi:hypothetical protein